LTEDVIRPGVLPGDVEPDAPAPGFVHAVPFGGGEADAELVPDAEAPLLALHHPADERSGQATDDELDDDLLERGHVYSRPAEQDWNRAAARKELRGPALPRSTALRCRAAPMRALLLTLLAATALAGPAEDLAAIRKETDASKRRRMLKTFLKTARPAPASDDEEVAGVYNEGVRLALAHKLKAKYLTKRIDVRRFDADPNRENPHFAFDLIRGPRWTWHPPEKHDVLLRRKAGVIALGEARRIRFHIWVYGLDQGNIANPSGTPKRAAVIWLAHFRKRLRESNVREKPTKRRFNRHYGACYTFAISGRNSQGKLELHRCWFVVPRKGRLAMIQIEAADEKPDPELKVILASIRDP